MANGNINKPSFLAPTRFLFNLKVIPPGHGKYYQATIMVIYLIAGFAAAAFFLTQSSPVSEYTRVLVVIFSVITATAIYRYVLTHFKKAFHEFQRSGSTLFSLLRIYYIVGLLSIIAMLYTLTLQYITQASNIKDIKEKEIINVIEKKVELKTQSSRNFVIAGFDTLYQRGILVYDKTSVPLSIPSDERLNGIEQAVFNQNNQRKLDLARMFYEAACDCVTDGRNDVGVFMLHQAVELTCIALLRTCLGYRPTTHNIRKLFLLIDNITPDVSQLFPRSTTLEVEIFNTLQRAYSDVRYKDGYTASADRVFILLDRVRELLMIASTLCQDKWNQIIKHE